MNIEVNDTSKDYDDLVGYKAKENIKSDLSEFFGEKTDDRPEVYTRPLNPDFPEKWQNLYVNFRSFEDYSEFMKKIGGAPLPKTKSFVYSSEKDNNLLKFLGD